MPNLRETLQWYEAIWIACMTTGLLIDLGLIYYARVNSVDYRRTRARAEWADDPLRLVVKAQLRTALWLTSAQIGGVAVGITAALTAPPPGSPTPTTTGIAITLYLLFLSVVLVVVPGSTLLDTRKLLALAREDVRRAANARASARARSVASILGIIAFILVVSLVAYGYALYEDLLFQARLDNGVAFAFVRFVTQYFRAVLNSIVTGCVAALLLGGVLGAFYRLRGLVPSDTERAILEAHRPEEAALTVPESEREGS